jgi:hypothetical protein
MIEVEEPYDDFLPCIIGDKNKKDKKLIIYHIRHI